MYQRILATTMFVAALAGCSRGVLENSSNVSMTVEDRKSYSKRFWVTLVDQRTGQRFERVRFSGKRCSSGPSRLHPGQTVTVSVDTYRDEKTGKRTRYVDTADLDHQFC